MCHLSRSRQAVSGCSLRQLCVSMRDACQEEMLAASLCECQLLLCNTSQRSAGVIDVSLCCVRHVRRDFLPGYKRSPINQLCEPDQ